ncbi:MAG: helix-turn-helix domain-containing protein [Methylomarinum sp.]|nr:helix-turn-helix domain-containing protein [Methylomarinum sp.]
MFGRICFFYVITAGIDIALALVEEDYGSSMALAIARMLVLYMRRSGGQSQFSAPMKLRSKAGEEFSQLYDWILENVESPLLIEDLAERAIMSPRNFARIFTEKTGVTPGKYVELIRLNKARELLESGKKAVDLIARISGFQREERMRRVFIRTLGITPSQYRTHFNKNNN